ncbi:MAG: hypothetical protein ACTSX2_13980 [Candidatus Thorarchaeota archaeon]
MIDSSSSSDCGANLLAFARHDDKFNEPYLTGVTTFLFSLGTPLFFGNLFWFLSTIHLFPLLSPVLIFGLFIAILLSGISMIWSVNGIRHYFHEEKSRGCCGIKYCLIVSTLQIIDWSYHRLGDIGCSIVDDRKWDPLKILIPIRKILAVLPQLAPQSYEKWVSIVGTDYIDRLRRRTMRDQLVLVSPHLSLLIIFLMYLPLEQMGHRLAYLLPLFLFIIFIPLVGIILVPVKFIPHYNKNAIASIGERINTPEARAACRDLMQEMIQVLSDNLTCPLRVMLTDRYKGAYRSGRRFTTQSNVVMIESFVIPSRMEPPSNWSDAFPI